ncbi:hypothetical protein B0H34DRAFT_810627 [Crassisporium funariophilum]|nr:hypothetical protein B0H34DRAFT_810627 [Crassisporium funariophilum]
MPSSSTSSLSAHSRPLTRAMTRSSTTGSSNSIVELSELESPAFTRHKKDTQDSYPKLASRRENHSPEHGTHRKKGYMRRNGSFDDHYDCKKQFKRLQEKYDTAHDNLTKAIGQRFQEGHTSPSQSLSSSSSSSPSLPGSDVFVIPTRYRDLTRQNAATLFPNIKFWYQANYTKHINGQKQTSDVLIANKEKSHRGNTRSKEGENVSMGFAEEDDGTVVDKRVAEAIRELLRTIFNSIHVLPKSWGQIGLVERQYVFNELYRKFPFLLLCFDDWKASFIAGRCLSTYHGTNKKRLARDGNVTVKTEPIPKVEVGPAMDNTLEVEDRKRKRTDSDVDSPNPKRAHTPKSQHSTSPPIDPQLQVTDPRLHDGQITTALDSGFNATASTAPVRALSVAPATESSATETAAPDSGFNATASTAPVRALSVAPATESSATETAAPAPDNAIPTTTSPATASPATAASATPTPPDGTREATTQAPVAADVAEGTTRSLRATARRPIINPITKMHGPPSVPTKRSDALRVTQAAQNTKADAVITSSDTSRSRVIEGPSATESAPEPSSTSKTLCGNLKKVTKSNAPKNLCYQAYLENHEPLTPAAFEVFYKALPKDEVKQWNELSKLKKGLSVENDANDG